MALILLWLLGVPGVIILLLFLLGVGHCSRGPRPADCDALTASSLCRFSASGQMTCFGTSTSGSSPPERLPPSRSA